MTFRDLEVDDYPVARRLIAAAFAGEPFATGMFGESPLSRFLGMANEYASWPQASNAVTVVAEAGGTLVGVAQVTLPGECHLCDGCESPAEPVSTVAESIEREFQSRCRDAHLMNALPPHAHITTVATEPFVNGGGIGRSIMTEVLGRLEILGVGCAVLECLTTREPFYEKCGFGRVTEFADPGGPNLRCVLMRIDLPA